MKSLSALFLSLSLMTIQLPGYAANELAQISPPPAAQAAKNQAAPAGLSAEDAAKLAGDKAEKPKGELPLNDIKDSSWIETVDMEKGDISMVSGRSKLLRLQRKIARISVSKPDIVDAVIISPKEILLNAKTEGAVNVILWDHLNEISVFDVTVTKDPNMLQAVLKGIAPDADFQIYPSDNVFVIKGEVASVSEQKEVEKAANAFAEGSVSLVRVKEAKQVLLKIRFVELSNSQGMDFGMDVQYMGKHMGPILRPGGTGGKLDSDTSFTPLGSKVGYKVFDTLPDSNGIHYFPYFTKNAGVSGFLKAVENSGVGKVIARPNLLASDGEEASFLVGGEAAVVAISSTNVGVEYREFGTRLTFTPQILPNGKIRLAVAPEVSSLDFANGVVVNSVTIPSFSTIRTSTVIELRDSETFMIGGLLQQKLTITDSGFPGLRRIPLIGKIFDNTDHTYTDTELIVIVTPIIVQPDRDAMRAGSESNANLEKATDFMPWPREDEQQDAAADLIKKTGREPYSGAAKSDPLQAIVEKTDWKPQTKAAGVQLAQAPGIDALDKLKSELQWDALSSVSNSSEKVENVG